MRLRIRDLEPFLDDIHDYVVERYDTLPRGFQTDALLPTCTLAQSVSLAVTTNGAVIPYDCKLDYNKASLHLHRNIDPKTVLYTACSEPEIVALRFLRQSDFQNIHYSLYSTLPVWLPSATRDNVICKFSSDIDRVASSLSPCYAYSFLESPDTSLKSTFQYTYLQRTFDVQTKDRTVRPFIDTTIDIGHKRLIIKVENYKNGQNAPAE